MTDVTNGVRELFRPEVLELAAYHVPESSGLVKLDAMENPYPWPPEMKEAWFEVLREVPLNRYPDPSAQQLKAALRRLYGIADESEVLLGNGSDEIIQMLLMAVGGRDAVVLAPEPTFVMYRQISRCLGLEFRGVPLEPTDFNLDMDAMRAAVHRFRPAVIFIAYPNNPTGNLFAEEHLLDLLERTSGLMVIDEAYAAFAQTTFLDRVPRFPRLLVMRTLSKLGLAGLRLGFLVGAKPWITELEKLRLPYNINVLTQVSAHFALSRPRVFEDQVDRILESRERLVQALSGIGSLRVYPSRANFILFRLLDHSATEVFERLKASGVLIKNLDPAGGVLRGCLRVTVGTPEENGAFLHALRHILSEPGTAAS